VKNEEIEISAIVISVDCCRRTSGFFRLLERYVQKRPATVDSSWVGKKLPVVEGAEVCFCDEKKIGIVHRNAESFELADKYAEKFKAEGWKVSPVKRDRNLRVVYALKDQDGRFGGKTIEDFMSAKEKIALYFTPCLFPSLRDRMSTCSSVEISDYH
jgi:hypothetical protein